jgi:preprotein translocase subunit SecF
MLRLLHGTSYDFIKYWKHAFVVTGLFLVAGLGMFIYHGGLNYSIEFTGGTLVQAKFATPPAIDSVRSTVERAGFHGAEVAEFGSPTDFAIRAVPRDGEAVTPESGKQVSERIAAALHAAFGDAPAVTIERSEFVGPRVGAELKTKAVQAILISFLVTLMYLAFRFEWRVGLAAVLATAHDTIATIAFMGMLDIEVSLLVVAAILSVIGFSLNDTIVIFDRVREDLKKHRKESLRDTVNRAINETLPRTVMTNVITLAATLALLIFGGEIIRPFAWVMTFGIFTGTFSSVYIGGVLMLWIERRWPRPTTTDMHGPSRQGAAQAKPARPRPAGAGAR